MGNFYNHDLENSFNTEMAYATSNIKLLKSKAENVFDNIDKLSVFKVYMSTSKALNVPTEIKVRHNRVFNTECHYHAALDRPFDIYDNMGYCRCYGCGKRFNVIELIRNFIICWLNEEEQNEIFLNYPEGLAIEVIDAFINGVKPIFNKDGEFFGFMIPVDYEFANDKNLVRRVLSKAFEYYDSEDINKYIEESDKKTEEQDERISNYINIYGININRKFANKLCVSENYIKYRLNKHFLDEKLNISRIVELAEKNGSLALLPFGENTEESTGNKKFITFYETDDKVMELINTQLTKFFNRLEEVARDWSVIQNVKIEPDQNKFSFSIKETEDSDSTVDYEIDIEKVKSVKESIYSSVYKKNREHSKSTVLSIISGNYDLSKFPSRTEYTIIQALESSGVEVLFANNEFTYDYTKSPYMLSCKPCTEKDINRYIYDNRFSHKVLAADDNCLYRGLKYIMGDSVPIENMLGEVLFKCTYPKLWEEYYEDWEETKKQKAKTTKETKQD